MAIMTQRSSQQGIVILGSTGSIGKSALSVIQALQDRFHVVALAAASNHGELQRQIQQFRPKYAHLDTSTNLDNVEVLAGPDALSQLATLEEADIVIVATTGHTAIEPTIAALRAGKIVALANKETIVAAGEIVMREADDGAGELRTIDSEHSAIWQCLGGSRFDPAMVRRLVLTGSGGPFRGRTKDELRSVTLKDALNHPNWSMGDKITIDSATLMNKGLEIIEAKWLFDCPLDAIDVVIHPQQIVHSLVEFHDGALLAQLGSHDMRLPIQYALTYPERVVGPGETIDLLSLGELTFEPPDLDSFPLLRLARESGRLGATYPTVLSAADTVAVQAFLDGKLSFLGIAWLVEEVMNRHVPSSEALTLEAIKEADTWAQTTTARCLSQKDTLWR
jgi:1-deoxy-D-xylulose-5-phosphate reductoisomerase